MAIYPSTEPAYHAAWKRDWRRLNKEAIQDRKQDDLDFKRSLKIKPCVDCGEIYHVVAMEFDHLGNKKFNVSQNSMYSRQTVLDEIAKCDVVCILCHRDRTFQRALLLQSNSITTIKKRALREKVNQFKQRPCECCGKQYKPHQMDFDHIDESTKVEKISNMVKRRVRFELIKAEIAKCRLLCALCHRLRTEGVI